MTDTHQHHDQCSLAGVCSGCSWIVIPYSEQLLRKRQHLRQEWLQAGLPSAVVDDIQIKTIATQGLRDRVDLIIKTVDSKTTCGLYSAGRDQILDLPDCKQMSPALFNWYEEFKKSLPPIKEGSVRLRIGADNKRGVWLDFANLDIKNLFDERQGLKNLNELAHVEIGQKRKKLVFEDGKPKLQDAELHNWVPTFFNHGKIPVFTAVGAFTQVGMKANQALVQTVLDLCQQIDIVDGWLELGSGAGNFTLPLALSGKSVTALEIDPISILGLKKGLDGVQLAKKVTVHEISFQKNSSRLVEILQDSKVILADPPRSGLGDFIQSLAALEPAQRADSIIYVSCFQESLINDIKALSLLGYQPEVLSGVDLFPSSTHCEWIVGLRQS